MTYTDAELQDLVDEKPHYLPIVRDLASELLALRQAARAVVVNEHSMSSFCNDSEWCTCNFCLNDPDADHLPDCPWVTLYNAVKEQG